MQFTLERVGADQRQILSYAEGRVVTSHEVLTASAVVARHGVLSDWRPRSVAELTAADLEALFAFQPEVLLLGTGSRLRFPDRSVLAACAERGLGLEVMDTAAACRTYNVLASEGRAVAVGLFMITAQESSTSSSTPSDSSS